VNQNRANTSGTKAVVGYDQRCQWRQRIRVQEWGAAELDLD